MTTPAPSPATPTPTGAPAAAGPAPVAAAGPERLAQPGVLGRPRPFLLLAALSFVAVAAQDRRDALERLRDLVRDEHDGNLADPVVETGELGYVPLAEGHAPTVTVALSAQGYDALGVPGGLRPQDLVPVPADVVPGLGQPTLPVPGEGHVLLHVQADDAFVAEHVLRRAERDLMHDFTVVWAELAGQRGGQPAGRDTGRSLLGFLDGTSNLDPRVPADVALDDRFQALSGRRPGVSV